LFAAKAERDPPDSSILYKCPLGNVLFMTLVVMGVEKVLQATNLA
jgi:hypothetical protein